MGGTGSGEWTRLETKETVKSRLSVDIRKLKTAIKSGFGTEGYFSFSLYDHERTLSFVVMDKYLLLGVNPTLNSVELSGGVCDLRLVQTDCNFGGLRNWISCPACQGRVAIVYLKDRKFACRKCCNLTYASQQANKLERLMLCTQKYWCALGGTERLTEPIPDKPKGMHWRTYWVTVKKLVQAKRAMNEEFDAVFCVPDTLSDENR